jgi:hypothetical protein
MPHMLFMGIDPGKAGAVCVMDEKKIVREVISMPREEEEQLEMLRSWLPECEAVFMEAIPKFTGVDRPGAYVAVLYGNYKFLSGAIRMTQKVKCIELSLLKWMNHVIPGAQRSRDRNERKRQLLEVCRARWPKRRWTLQNCDAALIASAGIDLEIKL